MRNPIFSLLGKLFFLLALSSLCLLLLPRQGLAHEVQPTIADFEVTPDGLEVVLDVNIEALLSGIDLDEVTDTNDAADPQAYDDLRALPMEAIIARAPELLAQWNAVPLFAADGAPVLLRAVNIAAPEVTDVEQPRIATWRLEGDLPPRGRMLRVTWPAKSGPMVLRQQGVSAPFTGYLDGGQSSPEIALAGGGQQGGWQVFARYIPVGFDHILPKGLDHILFVLGLFFLSTQMRPLIWQVSAFTLAHTVTLALGALGWVNLPGSLVEPLIAASIVYVAVENIFAAGLSRWRPVIIFGFGLLHGLGFASVLGDFGLPEGQFIPALIGFNIGVELGQLAVIAIAFALVFWAFNRPWYRTRIAVPASCVIALVGAYWFVERVFL